MIRKKISVILFLSVLLAGAFLASQVLADNDISPRTREPKTLAIGEGLSVRGSATLTRVDANLPNNSDSSLRARLHFFYGSTCPRCQDAEAFLKTLKAGYPDLNIVSYEVFGSQENARLFEKFLKAAGEEETLRVPTIFIGGKTVIGYGGDQTTGKEIEEAVRFCLENSCPDPLDKIEKEEPKVFKLPLIGEFDPKKISLPVLAVVVGVMDGFNPCAMWVLLLLISLLLTVNSKKKIWLVGGTFILASGILYFLFMTVWLNLFLFLGYINFIRIIIGVVAVAVGFWRIRDFFSWKPGVCKVTDEKSHSKIEAKIRKILVPAALPATFLGIVALAFSVNLVELFCSAGFPAIFTQVLAIQKIGAFQKYLYILVYDFFYMLDDLIVFSLAAMTLQKIGFTDKYSRWSALIGGVLLLLLGLALTFKPELLMFA
ncbi:MAG: hypothetical protein Q8N16_01945 [bacterium]|nr:hypothetical protein [bacterium]